VANPTHAPHVGAPREQIHSEVLRLVDSSDRRLRAARATIGGCAVVGLTVIWVVPSLERPAHLVLPIWWTFLWLVFCACLSGALDRLVVNLAVCRFNRRYPIGAAERPVALESLSGLSSPHQAAQKMRVALGLPLGPAQTPEAQIQAALDQLSGAPTSPTAGLDVGPIPSEQSSARRASKEPADFIPLELNDPRDRPALKTPDRVHITYVPLEPLEKPIDEKEPKPT
jgi:hypothetical protein